MTRGIIFNFDYENKLYCYYLGNVQSYLITIVFVEIYFLYKKFCFF